MDRLGPLPHARRLATQPRPPPDAEIAGGEVSSVTSLVCGRRSASRNQSGLMLAVRITLPHFLVSSAMSLAKSTGEPASAATLRLANRACNLGSAMAALTSLFSRSTTSAGVFFGAPMPYHPLAS